MSYQLTPPIELYAGVSRAASELKLRPGEVPDASNFLFRKGEMGTRPGLKTFALTGAAITGARMAKTLILDPEAPAFDSTTAVVTATKLFNLNFANFSTEITGPGIALEAFSFPSIDVVNQVLLIGGNTAGLIRWDPVAGVYTVITDAPFRYVTGHSTRAVAAFALDGRAGAKVAVAYSDQGDETAWVAGAPSTAGSALLIDMPSAITGLVVLHNLIVLPHAYGFQIGYPTGIAFPPYRFEPFSRKGIGVFFPNTLQVDNNIAYFVGEDDIYTFDLQQIKPIGQAIRDELVPLIRLGYEYTGVITRMVDRGVTNIQPRAYYHLAPSQPSRTTDSDHSVPLPHFVYDIYEDHWSRMNYKDIQELQLPFHREPTRLGGGFVYTDRSGNLRAWDEETACETDSYAELPTQIIEQLSNNYRVDSALLRYRNPGETDAVKISVFATMGDDTPISAESRPDLGSSQSSARYMRAWARLGVVGQGFVPRIDVMAGTKFTCDQLSLFYTGAGEYKGKKV